VSLDIWNRQTHYYDPGEKPQPHGPSYRRSATYHGAHAKHDGLDGFTLDKNRIAAAKAKRERRAAIRLDATRHSSIKYRDEKPFHAHRYVGTLASASKRRWWTR
jgi:hypothetical protein